MLSYSGIWERFVVQDGLLDMRVESLLEDRAGTLWIGTHARGVLAYDGDSFASFTRDQGLSGNGVFGLAEHADGSIWAATNAGLCRRRRDGDFEPVEDASDLSFLWGACSVGSEMWFAVERRSGECPRVLVCRGQSVEVLTVDRSEDAKGEAVSCIVRDSGGRMWLGGDRLYVQRKNKGFERVGFGQDAGSEVKAMAAFEGSVAIAGTYGAYVVQSGNLTSLEQLGHAVESLIGHDADDRIWAATREGELLELGRDRVVRLLGQSSAPFWKAGIQDRRGRAWLGTYGFGLHCYSEDRVRITDSESGLPVDAVQDVVDCSDSVWVATSKGAMAITGESLPGIVDEDEVRRIADTTAVGRKNEDELWIGKRNGALYAHSDGCLVQCAKAEPLRRHRIDCIESDGRGGVWVGSRFGSGVAYYTSPTECVTYTREDGDLVPTQVNAIVCSRDGSRMFFGCANQAGPRVIELADGEFSEVDCGVEGVVSALCFGDDDVMWVGTDDGLHACDKDFVTTYGSVDGLSSDLVTSLLWDSRGLLWIGTEGGGVSVFDGSVFQSLSFDRPLCNTISGMCEGIDGTIWFATNGGLVWRRLVSSEVTVGVSEAVSDVRHARPEALQFPDTVGRLSITLSGTTETGRSETLVYRHRMVGFEEEWTQTRATQIEYPKLQSGEYRFEYQAVDADLNYSPLQELRVSVVADPRIDALNQALRAEGKRGELVGESSAMSEVLKQVTEVSWTDLTVLVLGETGTGKGLVAQRIHDLSERKDQPFIHVNCGAVQESLADSELFGHEKGAFTGAVSRRLGKFELAQGGTIFLDEIGDLPLESQTRLLRALQERTMERLGGTETIAIDVRVIAATNRDLSDAVREGRFRADLFYRLNVFPVRVPPLRERLEDVPLLAMHFVDSFASHLNREIPRLSPETLSAIQEYHWPGNVRELEHTLHRAVVLADSVIEAGDLGLSGVAGAEPLTSTDPIVPLEEFERRYFLRVLDHTGGVIHGDAGAARLLEMKPTTLRSRLEKLGIKQRRPRLR